MEFQIKIKNNLNKYNFNVNNCKCIFCNNITTLTLSTYFNHMNKKLRLFLL